MPSETNEVLESIDKHIKKFGWGIVSFEDDKPLYVTSVGIHQSLGFSEIIVLGLPVEVSHRIINSVALQMRSGRKIKNRTPYEDIIEGSRVILLDVDRRKRRPYFELAEEYYGHNKFPISQLVWSDVNNFLPWEDGYDEELMPVQPVLNDGVMNLRVV
jgi:hypothetical protein